MSTIEYTLSNKFKSYRSVIYNMAYYGISLVLLFSGVKKVVAASQFLENLFTRENFSIIRITFLQHLRLHFEILLLKIHNK